MVNELNCCRGGFSLNSLFSILTKIMILNSRYQSLQFLSKYTKGRHHTVLSYIIFSLGLRWVNCVYFICSYENALSCFHEHQWDGLVRGKLLISLYLFICVRKLYFSKPTSLLVGAFSQNHQLCASIIRAGPHKCYTT